MPENIQIICLVRLSAVCCAVSSGEKNAGDRACGRSDRRQRRTCASVRLAGTEENHRARDRSQAAGRQFGKIVLYIAMPRHFDKADFLRLQEDIPGVQSVEI